MKVQGSGPNLLYSLIPLDDFKAVLGIDDREDALSRYYLITATYTIEQYCKRRLLRKKQTDYLTFMGEYVFSLREYPVRRILSVHAATAGSVQRGEALSCPENLVDPKHYYCLPDEGIREDIPFSLVLRPPFQLVREEMGIKVRYLAGPENSFESEDFFRPHAVPHYPQTRSMFRVQYWAGYTPGKAPADLASACLELAAWSMTRYKGRRIGLTGAVRGNGKDGEHLETSMPENVQILMEPYKRRVI
ncbi:MAG: phage head-tail connector protein [Treponema sp.]|jgi:hypothetical protein|nr:phage head-tail connector protein [Treponema sp.]